MTLQNVEENVHLINLNSFNVFLVLCDVFSLASKGIKKKASYVLLVYKIYRGRGHFFYFFFLLFCLFITGTRGRLLTSACRYDSSIYLLFWSVYNSSTSCLHFWSIKRLLTVPGIVTLTLHGISLFPCTRGDRL